MNLNPKNWTAKAQAIAVLLIPVVVYILNKQFSLNIDANTMLALLGLGAMGAASVAHIDNGEIGPNNPQEAPKTPPTKEEIEAAGRKVLGVSGPLALVLLIGVLGLAGCSTGIGRATSLAVSGVPPTVPIALDSIEAEYDLRAGYQMNDIVASEPQTPEGIILQEEFKGKLQARIDATHKLLDDLRLWIGVEKAAAATATQDAAEKTRNAAINAVIERISLAKLKKAAADAKAAEARALVAEAKAAAEAAKAAEKKDGQ